MTRRSAIAFAAAAVLMVPGCGSANTGGGAADGSVEGATVGASTPPIQASDYDQSCATATDCVSVQEGNVCDPAAHQCANAAISKSAYDQYQADVAKALASCNNPGACGFESPPCCVAGKCQISTGSCPIADAAVDVATEAGPDADASAE
jgi:hypothetical protein